jgi:hypothetical protein
VKKTLLVLLVFVAIGAAVYGQSYAAQSVSGRVERENAAAGGSP